MPTTFFHEETRKVPSGACLPPDQSNHHFLKSIKYVALTLEMAVVSTCMLYVITLKEFNHTLCEALDLEDQIQVQRQS